MMSSTIASKLPVSAARSADGPSPDGHDLHALGRQPAGHGGAHPRLVVHHQHPCHPGERYRCGAVRSPGSELSQRGCVTLCPWRQANGAPVASQRPSVAAGVVGLGLLAVAGSACARPSCRRSHPRIWSARCWPQPTRARSTARSSWTTTLGLPALPDAPQAANGTSTARIWSDGDDLGRVPLPTDSGERTLVSDGTTYWAWNSDDRTVVKRPRQATGATERPRRRPPTGRRGKAIGELRTTSTIAVDGTAEVAGRSAYELVLTPQPPSARCCARCGRRRRREADARCG